MLLHDCQIITNDMLLTSSRLHVALYNGSLAMAPWHRGVYLYDALPPPAYLESGSDGNGRLHGAINRVVTLIQSHFVSSPLSIFLFWSGDVRTDKCPGRLPSGALTLSVSWLSLRSQLRFIFLLTSPMSGKELPSPAILKARHGLGAQETGKCKCNKATQMCSEMIKRPNFQMIALWSWVPC